MRRPQTSHPSPTRARLCRVLPGIVLFTALSAAASAAEPDDIRGPDITIIEEEERTVFEYRQGGVLRMVRIVPDWGKPYYLVPRDQTAGVEDLERADTLLPTWVIVEF